MPSDRKLKASLLGCWKVARMQTRCQGSGSTVSFCSVINTNLLKVSEVFPWMELEEHCVVSGNSWLSEPLWGGLVVCFVFVFFLPPSVVIEMLWLFFRLDPYRPLWEALWNHFKLSPRWHNCTSKTQTGDQGVDGRSQVLSHSGLSWYVPSSSAGKKWKYQINTATIRQQLRSCPVHLSHPWLSLFRMHT